MTANHSSQSFGIGDRVRVDDGEIVEYGIVQGVANLRPGEVPTLDIEFDSGVWCETPQRFVAHV